MENTGLYRLIVRSMEMLLCSIIPSAVCLFILSRVPSEGMWTVLCIVALLICMAANGFFWYWDNVNIGHSAVSYFVINTIAYVVFIAFSYAIYLFASRIILSAGFAGLRAFERVFKLRTRYSMFIGYAVLLIEMIAVYFLGHLHFVNNNIPVDLDSVLEEEGYDMGEDEEDDSSEEYEEDEYSGGQEYYGIVGYDEEEEYYNREVYGRDNDSGEDEEDEEEQYK